MTPKKYLFLFALIFVATFTLFIKLNRSQKEVSCTDATYNKAVYVNDKLICVEVVSTPQKMQLGLSGRESLGENEGMLFIFPSKNTLTFWMKDMNFDIDMIWIDGEKIVDVTKDAKKAEPEQPDGQLQIYSPKVPANKVLEVNSGYFDNNKLKFGDNIVI